MPNSHAFARYIALGDSLSIDLYAARSIHPAAARAEPAELESGLGAAALLYRNDDARWPEFAGRDLTHCHPGLVFRNRHTLDHPAGHPTDHYATNGATTVGVLAYQLHRVAPSDERTLVTVTAGHSDVLQMLGAPRPPAGMVDGMLSRMERLIRTVHSRLPNALLVLTTTPDPADGTGALDDDTPFARESAWIADFNAGLRTLAARHDDSSLLLADAATHFAGRGRSAPHRDRWYWPGRPAEVDARGASELRRVWLDTLGIEVGAPR